MTGIFIILSGCNSSLRSTNGRFDPTIRAGFSDQYQVRMEPVSFEILFISNHTVPLLNQAQGWWHDAIVYQVYPRSFQDSDGDGHGDLPGLISRLDYIQKLGFTAIWTLPLFYALNDGSTGRALGYEAIDYYQINPVYGTMQDFDTYLAGAHQRGIRVILDMVVNHTSKTHPWFIASEQKDPKYKDWYVWTRKTMPELESEGWKLPWGSGWTANVWHYSTIRKEHFYATWGGELNFRNPQVKQAAADIARYWLNKGVDGYRLDAIRYLIEDGPHPLQADSPSSLAYMKEYQALIKQAKPDAMTVGEIWSRDQDVAKYYLEGKGLDQAFTFDFQGKAADALARGKGRDLYYYIRNLKDDTGPNFFSPFLDNHDMKRVMTGFKKDWNKARLGAALLLTFKGTPYVYFGTEVGALGQYNPMAWDSSPQGGFTTNNPWMVLAPHSDPRNVAAQIDDPASLLHTYRRLIALRKQQPALRRGEIIAVRTDNPAILCYLRPGPEGTLVFIANFSDTRQESILDFSRSGLSTNQDYRLYPVRW